MSRFREWLSRQLRPQAPVVVTVSCNHGDEQFAEWLKKNIRRDGGNPGVFR